MKSSTFEQVMKGISNSQALLLNRTTTESNQNQKTADLKNVPQAFKVFAILNTRIEIISVLLENSQKIDRVF